MERICLACWEFSFDNVWLSCFGCPLVNNISVLVKDLYLGIRYFCTCIYVCLWYCQFCNFVLHFDSSYFVVLIYCEFNVRCVGISCRSAFLVESIGLACLKYAVDLVLLACFRFPWIYDISFGIKYAKLCVCYFIIACDVCLWDSDLCGIVLHCYLYRFSRSCNCERNIFSDYVSVRSFNLYQNIITGIKITEGICFAFFGRPCCNSCLSCKWFAVSADIFCLIYSKLCTAYKFAAVEACLRYLCLAFLSIVVYHYYCACFSIVISACNVLDVVILI